MIKRILGIGVLVTLFSILVGLSPLAVAQAGSGLNYQWIIGMDPVEGPAISRAANGETVEVVGQGTFSFTPTWVTGGGTLVHKNAEGDVIGHGTWTATRIMSFDPWGTSPGFPPTFEGGKAMMRINIKPVENFPGIFDGFLTVTCLIGTVPAGAHEGIKLYVPRIGLDFNQEVSGETLFIRLP